MDIIESLVERFLTHNKFFLSPQYALREEPNWNASIDFVVLDFEQSTIVAVEVSDAGGLGSVGTKASAFIEFDYFTKIKTQLSLQTRGLTETWPVLFLGFVRDESTALEAWRAFPDERFFFRPVKDTIENYWSVREKGLLPARPDNSLRDL